MLIVGISQAITDWRKLLERYPTFADANLGERIGILISAWSFFKVNSRETWYRRTVQLRPKRSAEKHCFMHSSTPAALRQIRRPQWIILHLFCFQQGAERVTLSSFSEQKSRPGTRWCLPTSVSLNHLADAIAMQKRWPEAIKLYEDAEHNTGAPARYESIPRILALYRVGEIERGAFNRSRAS